MMEFIRKLFSSDFMPHGMCYYWDPVVLWLNVASDTLIALSYYAIPFLLFRFAQQRRDLQFRWIFLAFGLFILACGTTHAFGALTVWEPVYRAEGVVKAITALASMSTFVLLVPLVPELVALPTPAQLARVNRQLAAEVEERRSAEERVRHINEELEERVAQRTAERHALQDQLIHSQKMEAVGRLAGGVAHDFNNLLTVILGYNEMIRDAAHNTDNMQEMAEYAEEVQHAAQRAASLTNQLLAFSRRQVAIPRLVDLNESVGQIERMLRRIIGEDVALEMHLAPTLATVRVDPAHLDQVIMNLAVNARDAMPRGGRLLLETAEVEINEDYAGRHIGVAPGQYVMLAVSDTGTGMDEATQARIFEPFFTTKETGKGTGLGLSIVYGIVKQNGGEVMVYSELGHGATFKIYLPVAGGTASVPETTTETTVPANGGETILLVEDEDQVRDLARTILTRRGYHVVAATRPAEALQVAATYDGKIDLLLTDLVMPGEGGAELAKKLAASRTGMRVLYMSGYTDQGVLQRGLIGQETPFLQKPFTAAGLERKVREVLG